MAASAIDAAMLADSPVGFWPLKESSGTTANDVSGNGFHGTYTGGFTLGATGPASDGETAVTLNGSTGYVTIPHQTLLEITGDITIEGWFKPTNYTNQRWLITKSLNNGGVSNPYETSLSNSFGQMIFATNGGANVTATAAGSAANWHQYGVKVVGTAVTFYLDGAPNGTGVAGARSASGRPVLIGQRDDLPATGYFGGGVAKVAIYAAGLSDARMAAHWAARLL